MSTLNILVVYDRWEGPDESNGVAGADKAPLTRTLDKKEVEDEVAEALGKLGHRPRFTCSTDRSKSLHALARVDCDLVFNLAESFAGNDTADYCIAAYLELHRQAVHRIAARTVCSTRRTRGSPRRSSSSTASIRRSSRARTAAGSTSRTTSSFRSS